MASEEVLRKTLRNADGKPFAKYKGLTNSFVTDGFELLIDEVQNDRAGHSRMRARVPMRIAGFPEDTFSSASRKMALEDLIARRFWESARTHARSPIPKTDGGEVYIPRPGQEVIERGSITVTEHFVEACFTADLPSTAGKVNATAAEELIFGRIHRIVCESMMFRAYKQSKLYNHIQTVENADHIRSALKGMGLVAFVAAGAILPRRDDDLAPSMDAEPFECSPELKVRIEVPNGEPVEGMGIPEGFTIIAGPSRSGKSVLLDAVFAGVYDHIPGDGREYAVSLPDSAYIMGEGGRPADSVDISMFVRETPEFEDTSRALSPVISSPMSELVAISEAVEMGSRLLLIDEEYSNPCIIRRGFLAVDDMITSVSEMGRSMAASGVSVLMVSGDASAASLADRVILFSGYRAELADVPKSSSDAAYRMPVSRCPVSKNMAFGKGRKEVSASAQGIRTVEIGEYKVNVPVAAFFDMAQTRAVADAVVAAKDLMDGSRPMKQVCEEAIEAVMGYDPGNGGSMHRARPRPIDLAAVLNRHPQMLCIQKRRGLICGCCRSSPATC